ncbi:MAG: NAD(P)H-dependent oxidoreductase [Proteobacteria bacterium]|nr:NAD(P)H-dependent oxidoreductase [Pseudomonadota bacterium]
MAKNLVIYYSRRGQNYFGGDIRDIAKGNTEYCVEYIKNAVGADVFEVETVKAYSKDYMTCTEEAKAETKSKIRPELKRVLESVSEYDNIFVCGPCWWGTFPCAVLGQLERLDWSGKRVFGLMTHEGSGLGRSETDLKRICQGAMVGRCLAVLGSHASQSEAEVSGWARQCVER